MRWRRRPAPPVANPWEEEGRRLAPLFAGTSAAVVVGHDLEAAARVALGIARVVVRIRRVAIADLTGASPTLSALAGDVVAHGITDSFLRGVSLNDVARPAADGTPSLFILPCGSETPVPEDVLRSDRWRRLSAGFADAGALLLLVAAAGTAGLATLVVQTDGAVSVGDVSIPLEWRVLAQAGDGVPVAARAGAGPAHRRRWSARNLALAGVLVVVILVGVALRWPRANRPDGRSSARGASTALPSAPDTVPSPVAAPAETVSVGVPVNPQDSAFAADFAVELVATNTVTGANSWLRERDAHLPGVTVSPVVPGSGRVRWHRVLAGAWHDRSSADSMLASLRDEGLLRAEAGLVVRVPLALLLEDRLARGAAPARVAALVGRGVPAYALLQDDGTVRLFAGAFESAAAAVPLGADLRAAGLAPQLAYRTGRTF
ncbi:MAG: hypothetical protein AAB224_06350 [Gemmatimonadota bacterium]